MLGAEDTTARLRERQKAGDVGGMVGVIDDDLLDHFLVSGTLESLPDKLVERYGSVADRIVLYFAGLAWNENPGSLKRWGEVTRTVARLTSE